jgi:hypothetical protein
MALRRGRSRDAHGGPTDIFLAAVFEGMLAQFTDVACRPEAAGNSGTRRSCIRDVAGLGAIRFR